MVFISDGVDVVLCFFFQAEDGIRDLTVTGVQTCALPIFVTSRRSPALERRARELGIVELHQGSANKLTEVQRLLKKLDVAFDEILYAGEDRKSTRLNSSHSQISYAVFCLKKKINNQSALLFPRVDLLQTSPLILNTFLPVILFLAATNLNTTFRTQLESKLRHLLLFLYIT